MLVLPAQGLPHALVGTYETYKRSTKLLLKWLKEKGSDTPPDDSQPVSLSEILKLAEAVRQQRTPLPSDVAYAFRNAITHRNQMTGWFNDQLDGTPGPDASTMRHEKFTETLQLVYDTLSAVKAPKSTLCKKISSAHARVMDENSPFHTSYNRYKTLSDKEEEEQLNADAMTHIHQAAPKQPAEPKKTPKKQHGNFNDMSILDDALSMIMESFLALMVSGTIISCSCLFSHFSPDYLQRLTFPRPWMSSSESSKQLGTERRGTISPSLSLVSYQRQHGTGPQGSDHCFQEHVL